jgi:hypothetical protein
MPKLSTFKGKSRWPLPVYVARLASGETARISFWSPSDKPIDIARGRYVAAYQCGEDTAVPISGPMPARELAAIVSGEVEYEGEAYADPMTGPAFVWPTGEAPKAARRKAPAWHALAVAALERGDAAAALAVLRQAA